MGRRADAEQHCRNGVDRHKVKNKFLYKKICVMALTDFFIFRFFDAKVFEFFDRIRPILAKDLHLSVWWSLSRKNFLAMEHILPMCTGQILSIWLWDGAIVEFSSKFPQHWAKCQIVSVYFPHSANVSRNGVPKLVAWLTECNGNGGQPKLMTIF